MAEALLADKDHALHIEGDSENIVRQKFKTFL